MAFEIAKEFTPFQGMNFSYLRYKLSLIFMKILRHTIHKIFRLFSSFSYIEIYNLKFINVKSWAWKSKIPSKRSHKKSFHNSIFWQINHSERVGSITKIDVNLFHKKYNNIYYSESLGSEKLISELCVNLYILLSLTYISLHITYYRGAKAPKKKKRHVSNRKVICLEIEIDPF